MATWNVGPYDNDDAVDWCTRLEAELPDSRIDMITSTLNSVNSAIPPLSMAQCCETIAAAAIVLQLLTGQRMSDSAYAPKFLTQVVVPPTSTPLRRLAIRALRAVSAANSAWRDGWSDDVEADEAAEMMRSLRRGLETAT